jgi:hypothetical protein
VCCCADASPAQVETGLAGALDSDGDLGVSYRIDGLAMRAGGHSQSPTPPPAHAAASIGNRPLAGRQVCTASDAAMSWHWWGQLCCLITSQGCTAYCNNSASLSRIGGRRAAADSNCEHLNSNAIPRYTTGCNAPLHLQISGNLCHTAASALLLSRMSPTPSSHALRRPVRNDIQWMNSRQPVDLLEHISFGLALVPGQNRSRLP